METRRDLRPSKWRRRLELAAVVLFALAGAGLLAAQAWPARPRPAATASPEVFAQASAMPNQGWLPLMVHFSAYGSHSSGAAITRYEWDLDGNGSPDYDATAQGGYASYLYSKPGTYTITLRVTDAQGRYATDQVTVQVRHPAASSVDYWTIFDDSRVGRIDIALARSDWQRMWADPEAKVEVPADAVILGERLEDVGFRMRGQFSLRESGSKKPWSIDTDAYVDGQEFRNLRRLILTNNIGDPSMLKEKLAYEMMRFAGVPAGHVAYVELWIDITDDAAPPLYWGIYTMIERVDAKYLANRFGPASKRGNLYKASHAQRGPMDLVYYGDRIEDYPTQNGQYAYGKMNNEEENDYSDIVDLCRVVDGTAYASEAEYVQALEAALNVDTFLRYMAVVNILDNWDSYPNTGNNYYLFNNPVSGRFEWIPWDLTWGGDARAPLLGSSGPGLVQRAPLYDGVFQVQGYRSQYTAYVDLLLRYWFTPDHIEEVARRYHRLIAPYVTQSSGDRAFYGDRPMFPPESFQHDWQDLLRFTSERSRYLRERLNEGQDHRLK
ncbi:MAG: CotH kinase family protein [Chloroflexia bacterium]|nr:CotH kinase family protein [Chloroflexia bacterium]